MKLSGAVLVVAVASTAAFGWWFVEAPSAPDPVPAAPPRAPLLEGDAPTRRAVKVAPRAGERSSARAAWVERNNAGVAFLEAGDVDAALAEFEGAYALEGGADSAVLCANLAETLVRRARAAVDGGDFDGALADLERAIDLDPLRDDLAPLLERWRRERAVEADFARYSSQRFDLSFDGERSAILAGAQRAVDVLETAYGEFWLFFGHDVVARGERIAVVLYSPEQFHDLTGLGHWAGGAYDGRVRVPVADFDGDEARWTNTLWHELAHAFLHDIAPSGLPGWLDEGLAQWLEPGSDQAVAEARAALSPAALHALAALDGRFAELGDQGAIRRGYAQALAFVDHLVRMHGEYVVRELVAAPARGQDVSARFRELVGFELEDAHRDFAAALD